jgi:hypothetical protein
LAVEATESHEVSIDASEGEGDGESKESETHGGNNHDTSGKPPNLQEGKITVAVPFTVRTESIFY